MAHEEEVAITISDDDGPGMLIVCQGLPGCELAGDAAVRAQLAGCIWCDRYAVDDIGRQTLIGGPGHG